MTTAERRASISLFVGIFLLLLVLKRDGLREPYYWDALGYVASTALDMLDHDFRLIHPYNTGHPPLFFSILAGAWEVFGTSPVVSHVLVLSFAAFGILQIHRIGRDLYGAAAGLAAAVLTLANQIVFAQIGTLNPPTAIFALGAAAVRAHLGGRRKGYFVYASLLVLLHQTAALFVIAITAHAFVSALLNRRGLRKTLGDAIVAALPLAALVAWLAYQAHEIGWVFNQGLLHNKDVFLATLRTNLIRHFLYDATEDNVNRYNFIAAAWILAASFRFRKIPSSDDRRHAGLLFFLLCALHVVVFSYSDDLPRYFMPILPFFYLAAVGSLAALIRSVTRRDWVLLASAAALAALFTTNYRGARTGPGWQLESNFEYADSLHTHVGAARFLEREHSESPVVTCWPMNAELAEPRYGYVSQPLRVSTDFENPPPNAIFYYSPQSACRGASAVRRRLRKARLLRRFERHGKRADLFAIVDE